MKNAKYKMQNANKKGEKSDEKQMEEIVGAHAGFSHDITAGICTI